MSFKEEINYLEKLSFNDNFIIKKGKYPILITAPHTMEQIRNDGTIKPKESYTKAIALYLNKYCNVSCMIKMKDTGLDANRDNNDEFKKELINFVRENNIKLVIDIHGASITRNFDIEFGTLNNLTADFSTIKELEEAFILNNIKNIVHNAPFKGGAITQYLYGIDDVDIIQLEINKKYRSTKDIDKLEKLMISLRNFIGQYSSYYNE